MSGYKIVQSLLPAAFLPQLQTHAPSPSTLLYRSLLRMATTTRPLFVVTLCCVTKTRPAAARACYSTKLKTRSKLCKH